MTPPEAPRDEGLLAWKLRLLLVGGALFLAAVFTGRRALELAAAAVVGAGVVLVLVDRYRLRRREDEAMRRAGEDAER